MSPAGLSRDCQCVRKSSAIAAAASGVRVAASASMVSAMSVSSATVASAMHALAARAAMLGSSASSHCRPGTARSSTCASRVRAC